MGVDRLKGAQQPARWLPKSLPSVRWLLGLAATCDPMTANPYPCVGLDRPILASLWKNNVALTIRHFPDFVTAPPIRLWRRDFRIAVAAQMSVGLNLFRL